MLDVLHTFTYAVHQFHWPQKEIRRVDKWIGFPRRENSQKPWDVPMKIMAVSLI